MPDEASSSPRVTKKSLQAKVTTARRALHIAEQEDGDNSVKIARLTKSLSKAQAAVDDWKPVAPKTVEPVEVLPDGPAAPKFEMTYTPNELEEKYNSEDRSAAGDGGWSTTIEPAVDNGPTYEYPSVGYTHTESATAETEAAPHQEDSMTSTETAFDDTYEADSPAGAETFAADDATETDIPAGLILSEPPAPMKRKSSTRTPGGPRKGKYDDVVDYLFNHPGVSVRVADKVTGEPATWTNSSAKQAFQKKYEDWNDDAGNVLIVTAVRLSEKSYGVWLKVGQPEVKNPVAVVADEFGSAESIVPSDEGSLDI